MPGANEQHLQHAVAGSSPDRVAAFPASSRVEEAFEVLTLFVLFPLALYVLTAEGMPIPLIPVLLAMTGLVLGVWLRRRGPGWKRLLKWRWDPSAARLRLLLFIPASLSVVAYVYVVAPERVASLPTAHTREWLAILAAYPLLSVVPQELLFRVYFFDRYRRIFPSRGARIGASALLFGFAHVVFGDWSSVLLSTIGGFLFAWTYAATRSFWMVVVEHTLYGWLLFTVAPAEWFYSNAYQVLAKAG